jgi:acyl-CoA synthetase (AMP-forming)/AMP-acid ligase II
MKIDDSRWDVYDSVTGRATVGDQLRRHAANQPTRTAIAHYDETGELLERLSYAELNSRVNRTATSLRALGVDHGDVVAIMSRNSADYVVTYLAAAKLGAVTTGINFNFRDAEIEYQIGHAEPTAIVVEAPFVERVDGLGECLSSIDVFVVSGGAAAPAARTWHRLEDLYADDVSDDEPRSDVRERDVLFLIYTSGTEAFPKAVMIPHRNYAISTVPAWSIGAHGDEEALSGGIVRSHDRWLFLTPLHTIAGLGNFTIVLSIGGTIVLPRVVDAELSVDLIERERVTAMVQTPTFFLAATQTPRFADADLSSIERLLTYGGTMPKSMIDGWNSKAPKLRWATYWGQSELTQLGAMGWFRTVADIPGGDTSWIGRPVGSLELQLVDEDGNVGDQGEAWCRSPSVMLGYYKDPDRTAETFDGGWLHTGDIMRRDADGNLYFLDRRKDMIKTGGYNVSSQEVERTLYSHAACGHVAVVGLPDEYWSEAVTAFVVPSEGVDPQDVDAAELIAYCKERLVNYKVPKAVIFLDALPVDGQGKVLKRELRRLHSTS